MPKIMEYQNASTDCNAVMKSQNRGCGFFNRRKIFQFVGSVPKVTQSVSAAAKNIVLDVDTIMKIASSKKMDRGWKLKLFQLLGGSDEDVQMVSNKNSQAHIDVLLNNIGCDKFAKICLDNEVPSTLICCLRLLRIIELQNSEEPTNRKIQMSNKTRSFEKEIPPITTIATSKVSALLCFFCSDPSIDKYIRPQLTGLLGMIGATYPPCGQHIASAAANLVHKIADSCLSMDLIIYLHDQRVIKNMLIDAKFLLQKHRTGSSDSGNYFGALKAIVYLVVYSCNCRCFRLLHHFREANGYQIINFSIETMPQNMTVKLMEFVELLVYCKTEETFLPSTQAYSELSNSSNPHFIPWNKEACAVIERIIFENIPILKAIVTINNGMKPNFSIESENKIFASFAVDTAWKLERKCNEGKFLEYQYNNSPTRSLKLKHTMVLLLNIFSSNSENFTFIESNYSLLSCLILAYPTIEDESVKNKILEILDMFASWDDGYDSMAAITVAFHVYFSLNNSLVGKSRRDSNKEDTQPTDLSKKRSEDTFHFLLKDTNKLYMALKKKIILQESQQLKEMTCMHLKLLE